MQWILVVLGVILVVADRWLKILAANGATAHLGGAQFILFKNSALVFSWPAPNWVAVVLMGVAIVIVAAVAWRSARRRRWAVVVACLCILVGAFSNLFDRIAYGYVIDWAYFGQWWPVFNIADVLVFLGVILLLRSRRLTAGQ